MQQLVRALGDADRHFDPSKTPVGRPLKHLLEEVLDRIDRAEGRARKRREADSKRFVHSVGAVLSDLVHAELFAPGRRIVIPMAKSSLSPQTRSAPFMTERFVEDVRLLAHPKVDAAQLTLGFKTQIGSERSTMRSTPWLAKRLEELEIGPGDIGRDLALAGDPLVLNGSKSKGKSQPLPLPVNDLVVRLRREMHDINSWLAAADLEYLGCQASDGVDIGRRFLRRVFNNGSFDQGGRLFHGFWQEMPARSRLTSLRIQGQPVVSLDFAQMAIGLAYAEVGCNPPEGDLYAIPGYAANRDGLKKVMNALLASSTPLRRMPQGTRQYFPVGLRFEQIYRAISDKHPALVPLFGGGHALRIMCIESRVIVKALLDLMALGVVALPIHDCLLVGASSASVAKDALERAYYSVTGKQGRVEVEDQHLRELSQSLLKKGA